MELVKNHHKLSDLKSYKFEEPFNLYKTNKATGGRLGGFWTWRFLDMEVISVAPR